jgi:hypothetical protein
MGSRAPTALIIVLLISACTQSAPGTATPFARASETFSRTSTPTQTSFSPTSTIPPYPTSTPTGYQPQSDEKNYTLKPLDDEGIWALIQHAEQSRQNETESRAGWNEAEITLLREMISRPTKSSHYNEAIHLLNQPDLYYNFQSSWLENDFVFVNDLPPYPFTHTLKTFREALEKNINSDPKLEISSSSLLPLINQLVAPIVLKLKLIEAKNIYGDGQPGWILEIRNSEKSDSRYLAVLGLSGSKGAYRLVSPTDEWAFFSFNGQSVSSYDLNGNGIPEIAIEEDNYTIGMAHYCINFFHDYEWNGTTFIDLTPNIQLEADDGVASCLAFDVTDGPRGTKAIEIGYEYESYCYIEGQTNPGGMVKKRRYEWNGAFFEMVHQDIEPLEKSVPDGNINSQCALTWVNEAGPLNDQAFQLLPKLIDDPDFEKPLMEEFGPAYRDYFRFRLGTWYAIRGQKAEAITLLSQARDHPDVPKFSTASKLARAFLDEYRTSGAYAGCAAAVKALDFESVNTYSLEYSEVKMLDAWGFLDRLWRFGPLFSDFPMNYAREDGWNVCSLPAAFTAALERESFQNTDDLTQWLNKQHIPYTGLMNADLDQDGRTDWILMAGTWDQQLPALWVILNKGNRLLPILVDARISQYITTDSDIPTAFSSFTPDPSIGRLNAVIWPQGLVIFKIVTDKGWTGSDIVLQELYAFKPILESSIILSDVTGGEALKLVFAESGSVGDSWTILGWDKTKRNLGILASTGLTMIDDLHTAENAVFYNGDTATAIVTLNSLIRAETDLSEPYLNYLLGRAYEKSGVEEEAIKTYLKLIQDNPTDPFTYIIQQRLELKNQ